MEVKISKQLQEITGWYQDAAPGSMQKYEGGELQYPYESRLDDNRLGSLHRFPGQLYVLIDREVFSSGEWLAAELRGNELGLFVGEPTGGGGSVPGEQLAFKLPNSKLRLSVSCKFFDRPKPSGDNSSAIIPDFWVAPSLEEFTRGDDPALKFVMDRSARRI